MQSWFTFSSPDITHSEMFMFLGITVEMKHGSTDRLMDYWLTTEHFLMLKNAVFWDVMPCGSCKNWHFGGTYRLHHHDKDWWAGNSISQFLPPCPAYEISFKVQCYDIILLMNKTPMTVVIGSRTETLGSSLHSACWPLERSVWSGGTFEGMRFKNYIWGGVCT
jgi:hypothetical protein